MLDVARVVSAYGLGDAEAVPITSRVSRLSTGAGDFALKVFTASESSGASIESSLLVHLEGYRVPRVVRTEEGEPLLAVDGHRVLLTVWEPGAKKDYREIDDAGWTVLDKTLAALHERLGRWS